ncbi:hypothetical protein BHE74_00032414 [Ensete ventricosum]|nr:hypothetical protein GW17_00035173 [Ensete ventricosum]RWW60578.1 hypothetical protein BHE74_00032414 [Ensete ventricosum]
MSPRISFSCDFTLEVPTVRAPGPPPDPNFEFLVGSHPMITADQIFFKGRLLPLKDNHPSGSSRGMITTLRDELRGNEEACGQPRERPPKSPIKWKELLGLKKSRNPAANKSDKNEGSQLGKSMQRLIPQQPYSFGDSNLVLVFGLKVRSRREILWVLSPPGLL